MAIMKHKDMLDRCRTLEFMKSRIPALDALSTFVPSGKENDPGIEAAQRGKSQSRWYPVDGGHKLLIPFEGQEYDHTRFAIEKGAWNHEHCAVCGDGIEPMTLCWVTKSGATILLCNACYEKIEPK